MRRWQFLAAAWKRQARLGLVAVAFFAAFELTGSGARAASTSSAEGTEEDPETAKVEGGARVFSLLQWTPPGHTAPIQLGTLLSVDGAVGPARVTELGAGFDVTDARLSLRGALEKGFGYFLQANLIQSRPILDAELEWRAESVGFRAATGYFRTPFSAELLIPAQRLDFIQRSQIVRALAPGRQIGVQLDQQLAGDALVVRGGVFNGNGFDSNDDARLLYMLRLDGRIPIGEQRDGTFVSVFEYGLNGAYSEDDEAGLGLGLPNPFAGKRGLAGADLRWTRQPVFVSAEAIYGSIEPNGSSRRDTYGYQASVGWNVSSLVQLLARYDAFYAGSLRSDLDLAIASLVLNFSREISLQLELRVPTRGEDPTPGGVASLALTF